MNISDSTASICNGTPLINVTDNRGNSVRTLQYNRTASGEAVEELISRAFISDSNRQSSLWDARLFELWQGDSTQAPNTLSQLSLSGQSLRSDSIDAGWSVMLYDAEGRLSWAQDSRGTVAHTDFDTLGRPVSIYEQAAGKDERVSERLIYGDDDPDTTAPQNSNLRGQLIRHYDEAGLIGFPGFTLLGAASGSTQQLLADVEQQSDWQGDDESVWKQALAAETYVTSREYDAVDALLVQTDARSNQQRISYDVSGAQCEGFLTLAGGIEQTLLVSITYSAAGQILQETAGNGVVTNYSYEPQTQRLIGVATTRPASGSRGTVLQDLHYQYDPVGNILSISNAAEVTRYFRNQAVASQNTYTYDALYQLLGASGRENANAAQQGPGLPELIDANNVVNYTRSYIYDRGGNLYKITHSGAKSYTNVLFVDAGSNRALAQDANNSITQENINSYFDPRGNVNQMQPGNSLTWDVRNQLRSVVLLDRGGASDANDREVYQYRGNARIRKQTRCETNVASNIWQVDDVIYLPGLELRTTSIDNNGTLSTSKALQIITASATGRGQVRVLHWDSGQPADIDNDQQRFSFDNQVRSVMLEVDGAANVLTVEEYYPYGGTAVWAGKNDSEVKYKYVRYSGKERDTTGLYYYGYRYYAPWLGRWINPDPAGSIDGPNLFRMVRNNPITLSDPDGLMPPPPPLPSTSQLSRKLATAEQSALQQQQVGGYSKYSSFGLAMHEMGIRIENIDDVEINVFIEKWREIGNEMVPPPGHIDEQTFKFVRNIIEKTLKEWRNYRRPSPEIKEVFRGDGAMLFRSYMRLRNFKEESHGAGESKTMILNEQIESPTIMSTSTDPTMNYVEKKEVMWHFNLDKNHQGVTEAVSKAEAEITFPINNKMRVHGVTYIPDGSSYENNAKSYGIMHRYVIKATMLAKIPLSFKAVAGILAHFKRLIVQMRNFPSLNLAAAQGWRPHP
ncbi:RHS repeat domain-containing protein [Paraburkholderia fungorum]|uniref:RHS repeat domain-containing protein n=1 Tax=Paraburkholderia fungorum TaxID=134537 RepID=UPI0038BDCEB8